MKTNVIFRGESGYAMINGVLQNVEFDSVEMTPCRELIYSLREDEMFKDVILYESIQDFENGKEKSYSEIVLSDDYSYEEKEIDGKMMILTEVWVMEGGKPVMHSEPLNFTHSYGHIFKPILVDGMYKSREDCLKFNSYDYEDEEGNIHTKVGIGKKVQLTPEQQEYINDLANMLNKAKELKIMLVINNASECLYAANTALLKDGKLGIDYDGNPDASVDMISSTSFYKVPESVMMVESEDTIYFEK